MHYCVEVVVVVELTEFQSLPLGSTRDFTKDSFLNSKPEPEKIEVSLHRVSEKEA